MAERRPRRESEAAYNRRMARGAGTNAGKPLGSRPVYTERRAAQLAAQDERLLRAVISEHGIEGLLGGAPTSSGRGSKGLMDEAYYSENIADDRTLAALDREYSAGRRRVRSLKSQVIREVGKEVIRAVLETAECMAKNAQSNIMNNVGGEGEALGPGWKEVYLADSIYLATPKKSGYEAAKAASQNAKTTKRRKWAPEVKPADNGPHSFAVVVASAYEGASAMHDGYADGRSNKMMKGTPFLQQAFDKCEGQLKEGGERAARKAGSIHVPTLKDEHIEQVSEAARQAYLTKRVDNTEVFDMADMGVGDGMARRRWYAEKTVQGRTRRYIAVEDLSSWFERVYENWAGQVQGNDISRR